MHQWVSKTKAQLSFNFFFLSLGVNVNGSVPLPVTFAKSLNVKRGPAVSMFLRLSLSNLKEPTFSFSPLIMEKNLFTFRLGLGNFCSNCNMLSRSVQICWRHYADSTKVCPKRPAIQCRYASLCFRIISCYQTIYKNPLSVGNCLQRDHSKPKKCFPAKKNYRSQGSQRKPAFLCYLFRV